MYSIIIILCLFYIAIWYLTSNREYWKKRNVKHVDGVLWRFLTGRKPMPEIIKDICDAHPKIHQVGIFFGKTPVLIVRDTENIKTVLHGDFQKFYRRGLVKNTEDIFTDNLIFVDDYNRWKLQRIKMSPFLTKQQLRNMFYVTERCGKDFIHYIESNSKIFNNPCDALYTYTTACISSAIFGIDKETQSTMETPLDKISNEIVKTTLKLKLKFALANTLPKVYKWFNLNFFSEHQQSIMEIVKEAMEKRKNDKKDYHDFIDTCLKLQKEGLLKDFVTGYETNANLEFLAAQAIVFLTGGIDTVTSALHFILLELSNNSEILRKVHHEVDKIFEDNLDRITFEAMEKAEYIDMVIKEGLRKYPPIGLTQRKCCKDTVLPNGNISVKKGIRIIIPIFALHRDKEYFDNPDVFDPERFSSENVPKIIKYSYIPFGEGKRMCIGKGLAIMQIKVCLVWLLHKYTLKEQSTIPKNFDSSYFAIGNKKARYEIIPRH